jgi:hypothetical protein
MAQQDWIEYLYWRGARIDGPGGRHELSSGWNGEER